MPRKGHMHRFPPGLLLGLFAALSLYARATDKAGIWLDVPFIKQTAEGCGSASIAMLLQYWSAHGTTVVAGRDDADSIQKQLYSRKGHGIFASDMERYLKASGFQVFALRGDWAPTRYAARMPVPKQFVIQTNCGGVREHSSTPIFFGGR